MIQKIKNTMLVAISLLTLGAPILAPVAVYAACDTDTIKGSIGDGVDGATGNTKDATSTCTPVTDGGTGSIQKTAKTLVNIFSVIVGVTAILFVIYGGFKYITSGGDSSRVSSAKSTLIFALVGLVIVALAQLIVRYVLTTATTAAGV